MIEDEGQHNRRVTQEWLDARFRTFAITAVVAFVLVVVLVRIPADQFENQPYWAGLLFRVFERAVVATFAVTALLLLPMTWYYRRLLRLPGSAPPVLPRRYRVVAWTVVSALVAIFIAFMWYSLSRGLTSWE